MLKKLCSYPGCHKVVEAGVKYCDRHKNTDREKYREYKRKRMENEEEARRQQFYNSKAWEGFRANQEAAQLGVDIFEYYTMNKQITRLTLDVGLRDSYKVVFAKMGDTERRVIAEIKDNGEDYSLAGVNTVEVRCRKADGKQVTKNATKDNNAIVIDISGQMTTCKGTKEADT